MIRYSLLFLATSCISIIIILLYKKFNTQNIVQIPAAPTSSKKHHLWVLIIGLECSFLYCLSAYCLSTAWLKGDDYIFFEHCDSTLKEKLVFVAARYINWVSRLGDVIASLLAISENRWQHVLLTPLFIIATPFAAHRLLAPRNESIFSAKGAGFILFFIFLFTINVSLTPWRNFWCYAAAVNYIWPMPVICLFLSFFREDRLTSASGKISIPLLFLLGLYSAWSLECVTLFLLPGIIIWALLKVKQKKHIPIQCFSGLLGVIWGSFFLLSTPALQRRAAEELAQRAFKADQYDWQQMVDFVLNKTPENLAQLRGSTVAYLFDGIPLPLHAFYIPELMEAFLPCCTAGLVAFGILALGTAMQRSKAWKQLLLKSCMGVIFAMVCACAYLASCIPTNMSFLPPAFIILLSGAYLFLHSSGKGYGILKVVLTAGIIITSCIKIAPSVMEAAEYKKYEKQRLAEIHRQIEAGRKDIALPPQFEVIPQDKLGLIMSMDIHDKPEQYPNFIAAKCYKVDSITQQKASKTKTAD